MKKIVSAFLALVMSLSLSLTVSFAIEKMDDNVHHISVKETFDDYKLLNKEEFLEQFCNDEFVKEFFKNADEAELMGAIAYENYMQVRSLDNLYEEYDYAFVPTMEYMQPLYYYCGPASAYLAIYGWGGTSAINGSSHDAKVYTLGSQMHTDNTGTNVGNMCSTLNSYAPTSVYKSYRYSTVPNEATFRVYCYSSLSDGRAPILLAKTENISYYNGHASGHYIEVCGLFYDDMTIKLSDTNPNSLYRGIKLIDISDAYAGISNGGGLVYWW